MRSLPGLLLGWLLLVLGLLALARGGQDAAAERILAYPLDQPVRFDLEAGASAVKLVSWLAGPPRWARDVRATAVYSLEVTLRDRAGVEVARWPVRVRARGSLLPTALGALRPPARLAEGDGDLSDDRLTLLPIGALLPGGGDMTVASAHTPPGHRVLLIAFRESPRSAASRIRLVRGQAAEEREGRAGRLTPFGWAGLPERWQEPLAARRWERLGALPDGEGLVPTARLFTTFEKGSWWDAPAAGVPVPPHGALAFNLEGPTTFQGRWWTVDGHPAGAVPTTLRVRTADGREQVQGMGAVAAVGPLSIGPGVTSVQLTLEADAPYVFRARTLEGALDRAWGDPPREAIDPLGHQRVAPDLRNLELFRATPEGPPLRFPLTPGWWARLRLFVRLPPLPSAPARATVTLRVRGADGAVLATHVVPLEALPSAFERYTQVDDPATAAVAEPQTRTLKPPPGATVVEVLADVPVDVGFSEASDPDAPRVTWAGYDDRAGGRWVPLVRNPWRARYPEDLDALIDAGRAPRVDAQVRLEAPGPARDLGPQTSLPLWEPFELIARPDPDGGRTRLHATPRTVEIPPSGRLEVDHRVAAAQVGATAVLRVDGAAHPQPLLSAGGALRVDGLTPGPAEVSVDAPGLFLARAAGPEPWQLLRVVRLEPGQRYSLAVPAGPAGLSLHLYGADGGALIWTLDDLGEPPPGLYEGRTRRAARHPLTAEAGAAWPLSWAAAPLSPLATEHLTLETDLPAAGATLRFWLEDRDAPVWLRATATWATPSDPVDTHRALGGPR
ncbi:MAG: hypothetical protein H6739_12925 [Alphaproteobacteria bacterium]|nr:hypothetical protein [Alphaproteobacteria bacterium]